MGTKSQSIVITGGASGIGLAITKHYAKKGRQIAILDINATEGSQVTSALATKYPQSTFLFKECDVSSWDQQAAVFKDVHERYGRIDIVIANAGISEPVPFLPLEDDTEPSRPNLKTLEVNLLGVMYSVRLAVHYMRKNKVRLEDVGTNGLIICTASNAGIYPFPVAPVYGTSKHGVIGLVRSLAPSLDAEDIQINALAPSVLETNIAPDKSLFEDMILTPMSTLVEAVAMIDKDRYLTGEVAEVHGGGDGHVTLRQPPHYVDKDSEQNLVTFSRLGYA